MIVIYAEGGIYLDTDVELLKPLSPFLKYDGFAGWETKYWFTTAIFGAIQKSQWIGKILQRYELANPREKITTNTFLKTVHSPSIYAKDIYGVQADGKTREYSNGKFAVFEPSYFTPKHYITDQTHINENTVAFHHYASTWHNKSQKIKKDATRITRKAIGRKNYERLELAFHHSLEKQIRKELP